MAKILITGGAGFIGSHLTKRFLQKKHDVVIVDNLATSSKENIVPGVKLYKANILSKDLITIFKKEKPDFVSHHAAQIKVLDSIKSPQYDAKTNILGTINVLECAQKINVKKIIFSSSGGAIYGNALEIPTPESYISQPEAPYGISKLGCEFYIKYFYKQYKLPYTILRYANVFGPGQRSDNEGGVIAIFVHNALLKKPLVVYGDGMQARDFIFVSDIVAANELAIKHKDIGLYNVGTGKPTSINLLIKTLQAQFPDIRVKYVKKREGEVEKSVLSVKAIKNDLQWKPQVTLAQGTEEMFRYYDIKNKK